MQFETSNYSMQLLQTDDQTFFTALYQDPVTCQYTGGVFRQAQALAQAEDTPFSGRVIRIEKVKELKHGSRTHMI